MSLSLTPNIICTVGPSLKARPFFSLAFSAGHQGPFRSLTFPPVLRDWVIKGFGISSLVYATGHIQDPVPLIEKRRGLSPGGRFPPSFTHQVIIITGLNKLQLYVLALKMALDADRA